MEAFIYALPADETSPVLAALRHAFTAPFPWPMCLSSPAATSFSLQCHLLDQFLYAYKFLLKNSLTLSPFPAIISP